MRSPFRYVQPFEQIDELAELRRTVVDLECAAADDAHVIARMHSILRRQQRAGWLCNGEMVPLDEPPCDDCLPLYVRHPKEGA